MVKGRTILDHLIRKTLEERGVLVVKGRTVLDHLIRKTGGARCPSGERPYNTRPFN